MLKKLSIIVALILVITTIGCGGGNLKMNSVQFANSVTKFGNYTKIDDPTFKQKQVIYVVAIAEGFISEQTDTGYSSWPIMTLKLRDDGGRLLNTQQPFKDIVDKEVESNDHRLPAQIKLDTPPGKYNLEVIIEDGISGDRVTSELPFEITE